MSRGYPEATDPFTGKAPDHQRNALKNKGNDLSNTEIAPVKEVDVSSFDEEYLKERFLFNARRVWGDVIDEIHFKFTKREPKKGHVLSLAYSSRPRAISNALISAPTKMNLYYSDIIFNYSKEDIEKIIIHEVIHIGYPDHTEEFMKQVTKFGGVKSMAHLEGLGIQVQSKKRANKRGRFKTVMTFTILKEDLIMTQGYPEAQDIRTGKAPDHQKNALESGWSNLSDAEIVPLVEDIDEGAPRKMKGALAMIDPIQQILDIRNIKYENKFAFIRESLQNVDRSTEEEGHNLYPDVNITITEDSFTIQDDACGITKVKLIQLFDFAC
jgi:hypothetical protein